VANVDDRSGSIAPVLEQARRVRLGVGVVSVAPLGVVEPPLEVDQDESGVRESIVVSDATATFERAFDGETFDAETTHRTALAHLEGEFADVATTAELLGEG